MTTTIATLLWASLFTPGFLAQQTLQAPARPGVGSRVPVDVSVQGLGDPDDANGASPDASGTPTIDAVARLACLPSLRDVATGGCLAASSTPMLGALYPLSPAFNIDPAGNLRMGPASFFKAGKVFLHTRGAGGNTGVGNDALRVVTGQSNTAVGDEALALDTIGSNNTAVGRSALTSNTSGNMNTATGSYSLYSNTTGTRNTATGDNALYYNTTGYENTASGASALLSNTTGLRNTATGAYALRSNTYGSANTALGVSALVYNTTGSNNIAVGNLSLDYSSTGSSNTAIGVGAGSDLHTGSGNTFLGYGAGSAVDWGYYNIAIGNAGKSRESQAIRIGDSNQVKTFIAGIRGVTTANTDAVSVLIDSAGQLGTVSSARRFKEDIDDMGDATEHLLDLRPVVFRYKKHERSRGGDAPLEYGLIAEEVADVFPDLVVYDSEGRPETVKYRLLGSMLLNELKKLKVQKQAEIEELRAANGDLRERIERLEASARPGR